MLLPESTFRKNLEWLLRILKLFVSELAALWNALEMVKEETREFNPASSLTFQTLPLTFTL